MLGNKRASMQAQAASLGEASWSAHRHVPHAVQYTSPVSTAVRDKAFRATTLPLNLIALIVSYLDDIGDIARVTRTCRLLYYMTLPQLYENVSLRSYARMRYVDGQPEGFGSGSPFIMALNGLSTKPHASLVRNFKVWGSWQELGAEEYAKGRVPDNAMMLNIILRAAMDKMTKLQSFCWNLDCKPLKTLYQGLGNHSTVTSFTLKFPSTKSPRPSVLIPPMANLRVFKATDIDPMCYPDDISMLMLGSKKLEDVRLHFCPRMRAEAENIMNLMMFFGRCHQAGYKLKIKHFALHNFFGGCTVGIESIICHATCRSVTFLNTFGGNNPRTIFVDSTWQEISKGFASNFTDMRCNELAQGHLDVITAPATQLQRFYIVSDSNANAERTPSLGENSPSTLSTNGSDSWRNPRTPGLKTDYIYTLTHYHGDGLRHLLLSDRWSLTNEDVANLARHCPNLEQLGLAMNTYDFGALQTLFSKLPKLKALRILHNEDSTEHLTSLSHSERMHFLSTGIATEKEVRRRLVIGVGDMCYKLGNVIKERRADGSVQQRHEVTVLGSELAMEFEIWRLDCLDISLDPIAPFSP